MENAIKATLTLTVFIAVSAWWSWFWVTPRDQFLNEISACMTEVESDSNYRVTSKEAYDLCYDRKTNPKQKGY